MQNIIIDAVCVLAIALSFKSILVLRGSAPWTSAGWWLTIAYLAAVIYKVASGSGVPGHAEYIVLGALTVAFIVAGVRDERQAEPWWWPTRRSPTRAEKRGTV